MHGRTQRAGADPTRPDPEVGNGLVERERATSLRKEEEEEEEVVMGHKW